MKARSLVFDLFGDYLRYRGGEVRLRALVALMDQFEVPEATVRVVVARLRKEGWLASRRDGRETVYSLTPGAWTMLDEGRARIFDRERGPWDGQWHTIIYSVPESERALREQLRKKLTWLGYGSLSPSVWLSPHRRITDPTVDLTDHPQVQLDVLQARSTGVEADRDMASRAWDLAALDHDYAALLERYEPRLDRYRAGLHGVDAMVERTTLIHDYRRFPFRDPDLPLELLPSGWSGRRAHDLFLLAHGSLRAEAERYVDEVIERTAPAADRAAVS